jgi:hypothetical protein
MRKSSKKNIIALGISTIICLIALEAFARQFPMYKLNQAISHEIGFNLTDDVVFQKDDHLMYVNGSLSPSYCFFDDYDPNKTIVAVIGDSFAAGGAVRWEDSYVPKLKENLGDNYEVLGFAMGGLNARQKYILLKGLALKHKPDMIIIQFCPNDFDPERTAIGKGNGTEPDASILTKTDVIIVDDILVPTLPILPESMNRIILKSDFMKVVSLTLNGARITNDHNRAATINYMLMMKEISGGTPIMVVNFPTSQKGQCEPGLLSDLQEALLAEKIPYLDLCTVFNPLDYKNTHESSIGGHYNEEGYSVAAAATSIFIHQNFK